MTWGRLPSSGEEGALNWFVIFRWPVTFESPGSLCPFLSYAAVRYGLGPGTTQFLGGLRGEKRLNKIMRRNQTKSKFYFHGTFGIKLKRTRLSRQRLLWKPVSSQST